MLRSGKESLDKLQSGLGKLMPKIPGMPVGKFYDLAIGVDIHPTTAPPSPAFPVPHIGMVYDMAAALMAAISSSIPVPASGGGSVASVAANLIKGMAPSVKVHGQWIANAGMSIQHLPGIILHALPTVAPTSYSEMWMGSSTVLADGPPCSTISHLALSCNIAGFPPPPRKKKKAKMTLMAPTSLLTLITSAGKPVLVGGPPTIDMFQLAMKLGLKGLGKLVKKGAKQLMKITKKATKTVKSKLGKVLQKAKCRLFGEPVDVVTGRVYHTNTDFELPGPIPLVWERTYYSDAEIDGPLGYNWHHSYNIGIYDMGDAITLRLSDGREIALPNLTDGAPDWFDRAEQLTWRRKNGDYELEDDNGLLYTFAYTPNREGYRMVTSIATKDGFVIRFRYNSRYDLQEIIDSRNQSIWVETDGKGRIICISKPSGSERINLIRYRYDKAGNMVETTDANGVSKHFEYNGHLLSKLTNQSGLSFYWEYKGRGDNARCIHTWGDDGVLDYRFEYGDGVTHTTNSLGHRESYYYDSNNLIYKIVDANGGITRQFYNEFEELEVVVNPEGLSTKATFNDKGRLIQSTNENGESTRYVYDKDNRLTHILTPGGQHQSWEYDASDRVTERTNEAGETLYYEYEGKLLKAVADSRLNRIELEYDRRYDLVRLAYSNGLTRRWEYDEAGRMTLSTDVNGNTTRYRYDRMDNLIEMEEPDGNIHQFSYDASGEMIHAKDKLHEVAFAYGPMGILKSRTQNGRTVHFGYDTELQLRTILNEGSEKYRFDLDGMGQVVKETGFDGLEREYIRDGAGHVRTVYVSASAVHPTPTTTSAT